MKFNLAHLSFKLMGKLIVYQTLYHPASVCLSTFLNTRNHWTNPFDLEDRGANVCSNGLGHMANVKLWQKHPSKTFFSGTKRSIGPRCEKTCLRVFLKNETQTSLLSHRD